MKPTLEKRLATLESKMQWFYADEFFEEWLQEHYQSGDHNIWEILDTFPQEFRLACLKRTMDAIQKAQNTSAELVSYSFSDVKHNPHL